MRQTPFTAAEERVRKRLQDCLSALHIPTTHVAIRLGIGRERLMSYTDGRVPCPPEVVELVKGFLASHIAALQAAAKAFDDEGGDES